MFSAIAMILSAIAMLFGGHPVEITPDASGVYVMDQEQVFTVETEWGFVELDVNIPLNDDNFKVNLISTPGLGGSDYQEWIVPSIYGLRIQQTRQGIVLVGENPDLVFTLRGEPGHFWWAHTPR